MTTKERTPERTVQHAIDNTEELRDALFHDICLLDHASPENDTDHRDVAAAGELAKLRERLTRQAYVQVEQVPAGELGTKSRMLRTKLTLR